MTGSSFVECSCHETGVAVVTLNRPSKLNALNAAAMEELSRIWTQLALDHDVRAIVLCGEGDRAFCSGSDLREVATSGHVISNTALLSALPGVKRTLDKPVIAALHGFCIGTGVTLAAHADLRIAAPDTTFTLPEVGDGMVAALTAARLPRMMPLGRAIEFIITGRTITAEEAAICGLVNRVVDDPRATACELAVSLAAKPPKAMQASLRLARLLVSKEMESMDRDIRDIRDGVYADPGSLLHAHHFTTSRTDVSSTGEARREPQSP